MRTLKLLFVLIVFNFYSYNSTFAQDDEPGYVLVEYMKVKPGMGDLYIECEEAWKFAHQYRLDKGQITGWELEQVLFPSGIQAEYDYMTTTFYKNWNAMRSGENWFRGAMEALSADKREIAMKAEEYRDIVKREIWTAGDMVWAPNTNNPQYRVENFMNVPANGWEDWIEMETEFAKPAIEKSIAMGYRSGWIMGFLVYPRGEEQPYQASTLDYYDNWSDLNNDEGKAWNSVYPKMDQAAIGKRIESTRTIIRSEVRQLIDFVR